MEWISWRQIEVCFQPWWNPLWLVDWAQSTNELTNKPTTVRQFMKDLTTVRFMTSWVPWNVLVQHFAFYIQDWPGLSHSSVGRPSDSSHVPQTWCQRPGAVSCCWAFRCMGLFYYSFVQSAIVLVLLLVKHWLQVHRRTYPSFKTFFFLLKPLSSYFHVN